MPLLWLSFLILSLLCSMPLVYSITAFIRRRNKNWFCERFHFFRHTSRQTTVSVLPLPSSHVALRHTHQILCSSVPYHFHIMIVTTLFTTSLFIAVSDKRVFLPSWLVLMRGRMKLWMETKCLMMERRRFSDKRSLSSYCLGWKEGKVMAKKKSSHTIWVL